MKINKLISNCGLNRRQIVKAYAASIWRSIVKPLGIIFCKKRRS